MGSNTYNHYASGQIANASYANGKKEDFTWDGLALLQRNSTNYLNEPYATGGNPVLANGKVLFNDMLGTTQGSISKNGKYQPTNTTAFGAGDKSTFFTGKPYVEGLGSVFLFRNYRPELSKWTCSDPLGYPDGWNNFAYGNNTVTSGFDYQGTVWRYTGVTEWGSEVIGTYPNHAPQITWKDTGATKKVGDVWYKEQAEYSSVLQDKRKYKYEVWREDLGTDEAGFTIWGTVKDLRITATYTITVFPYWTTPAATGNTKWVLE